MDLIAVLGGEIDQRIAFEQRSQQLLEIGPTPVNAVVVKTVEADGAGAPDQDRRAAIDVRRSSERAMLERQHRLLSGFGHLGYRGRAVRDEVSLNLFDQRATGIKVQVFLLR